MFFKGGGVAVGVVECKYVAEYQMTLSAALMLIQKEKFFFLFFPKQPKTVLLNELQIHFLMGFRSRSAVNYSLSRCFSFQITSVEEKNTPFQTYFVALTVTYWPPNKC